MNELTMRFGDALPLPAEPAWERPCAGLSTLLRGEGPVREVQIFGQRCSGTNVLAKLVRANFGEAAVTDRYGFKHWFVPAQVLFPDDALVLVVAREARDWVRSLHRQPWHAHPDLKRLAFADFIRAEWHSYWDDDAGVRDRHPMRDREMLHERDPVTGLRFANPLRKRAAKLADWTGLAARAPNVALLDHDQLHRDPEGVVATLAAILRREPAGDYAPTRTYKGNGFRRFEPTRYPPLDGDDERFIRAEIDPAVEARFGFG